MFVLRLATELRSRGMEVAVYDHAPEWSNKALVKNFSRKIPVLSYSSNPVFRFLLWRVNGLLSRMGYKHNIRNAYNARQFKKLIRKGRFDVVNSQMYTADLMTARQKNKDFTFVVTTHGEYELRKQTNHEQYSEVEFDFILKKTDALIYTTSRNYEAVAPYLHPEIPVKKIYVGFSEPSTSGTAISPETIGIHKDDFVIGQVARGIMEKGWEECISAYKLIRKNNSDKKIHLVLIGTGKELKSLYEKEKTEGIHLLQLDADPLQYYQWLKRFDAGLLLSYFKGESVPNVVIEYLYNNIPVLATAMGEIPQMITTENGNAGEIVPFKNGKADTQFVYDRINYWLKNPAYYQKMKSQSTMAFEKFKIAKIADQYIELFQSLIEK